MILSLLIAGMVFISVVAIVGISPMGLDLIGGEGTMTNMANATFWNTYSAFGLSMVIPIVAGVGILVIGLILILQRVGPK